MSVDAAQPSAGSNFLTGVINNLDGVASIINAVKGNSTPQPAAAATPGATGAGAPAALVTASPVTTAAAKTGGLSAGAIAGIAGGAVALVVLLVVMLTRRGR
jgi:hypothetical protein